MEARTKSRRLKAPAVGSDMDYSRMTNGNGRTLHQFTGWHQNG
jgi:hypothetical protein